LALTIIPVDSSLSYSKLSDITIFLLYIIQSIAFGPLQVLQEKWQGKHLAVSDM